MESVLKSSTMTTTDSNSTLDDRIGRGRYWAELAIFTLSSSLIYGVGIVAIVFAVLAGGQAGSFLLFIVFASFQLALTWRFLGYGAKRCHDLGHSGFYQLIPLYPLIMLFQEGDVGANEYGHPHGVTKDIAEKVKLFREAADQGDARAQYNLGICYHDGRGVPRDEVEAVKWYRKAAEQGFAPAQFNLGICHFNGEGVAKDSVQAVSWYRKAAEQGVAEAQSSLGFCYIYGEGVAKDDVQAVSWYRKAADQGNAKAQSNLANRYAKGEGVAMDEIEAYAYWNLAGITHKPAREKLIILKKQMTADQIDAGKKRTKELQKEIEAKIAAKNAEDANKAGK